MATTKTAKETFTFGGVVFDAEGRVLLIEPKGHFDGYAWTFPKGRSFGSETPNETAIFHVRKDTGYYTPVVACLPGAFKGGTGESIYYLMACASQPDAPAREADAMATAWVTPEEARERIAQTTNALGRARDLAVLQAALDLRATLPAEWLGGDSFSDSRATEFFARKLFATVAELHRRGYESLRIVPGLSPSGMHWRCEFVPASQCAPDDGALMKRGGARNLPCYSTAEGLGALGWPDAAARSPQELADRFEARLSALLSKCRTPDPAYARWFQEMLAATEPLGLPVAYADMRMQPNSLYVVGHCGRKWIPAPPKPPATAPRPKKTPQGTPPE